MVQRKPHRPGSRSVNKAKWKYLIIPLDKGIQAPKFELLHSHMRNHIAILQDLSADTRS